MDGHSESVLDAEDRSTIERQEQQPLRQKNGISASNGNSNGNGSSANEGGRVAAAGLTATAAAAAVGLTRANIVDQKKDGVNQNKIQILPASSSSRRKQRLPPRFDLDEETQNWRGEVVPPPSPSPSNSSAASSPSSPYRKKLVFTMPGIMRPKEPREYKLRVFVVFTFFVLVLLMSLTYVYHQQRLLQMMQRALGERIRFAESNRVLQMTNSARHTVLTADLGTTITTREPPHNCPIDASANETACLEWHKWARMSIKRLRQSGSARCYRIDWQSVRHEAALALQDCFSLADAYWYGVGEYTPQLWPMNFINTNNTAFVSGNLSSHPFGHVIERYWMSSKGVAIVVDADFPLDITFDNDLRGQLCLASAGPRATLNYTVCVADDTLDVYRHVVDVLRPKVSRPSMLDLAVDDIVWSTRQRFGDQIDETSLVDYTKLLQPFERQGNRKALLLDSRWQTHDGNFTFDAVRFGNMGDVSNVLHNRGYNLVLEVHPYVSTACDNYYKYLPRQFWVRDITGQVPSLVTWNRLTSAVVVDLTNDEAARWFQDELAGLRRDYKVVGFQFAGGEATSLPPYATFARLLASHDDYSSLYNKIAAVNNNNNNNNTGHAFSVGVVNRHGAHLPAFTELSHRFSLWGLPRGLRSVIPAVLSTSLAGYPFTLIGPVGGYHTAGLTQHPERELYVRWLQVAIFLPVLQLSVLPSDYDDEVVSIATKCVQLRRALILPVLRAAIDELLDRGTPIVRPLWWLSPNDSNAHDIDSEFLVGNDLLVAPILEPHADERDIYLPVGLWTDREGAVHKGGKWIYDHRSSLSKVAYFTRMPESQTKVQPYSNHRSL